MKNGSFTTLGNLTIGLPVDEFLQTRISPNFKVYETIVTEHAKFRDEQLLHFATNPRLWFAAARLANDVLEPLREAIGNVGFSPTSWGRCPGLNAVLPGSSPTSLHCDWLAADVQFGGRSMKDQGRLLSAAWEFLRGHKPAGEVILYVNTLGLAFRLHVAASYPGKADGERLVKMADGKLLTYVPSGVFAA